MTFKSEKKENGTDNQKKISEDISQLMKYGKQDANVITCKNCGWQWNKSDSSKKDMYMCHHCDKDNSMYYK